MQAKIAVGTDAVSSIERVLKPYGVFMLPHDAQHDTQKPDPDQNTAEAEEETGTTAPTDAKTQDATTTDAVASTDPDLTTDHPSEPT
mgnify:CR=1 FL=1